MAYAAALGTARSGPKSAAAPPPSTSPSAARPRARAQGTSASAAAADGAADASLARSKAAAAGAAYRGRRRAALVVDGERAEAVAERQFGQRHRRVVGGGGVEVAAQPASVAELAAKVAEPSGCAQPRPAVSGAIASSGASRSSASLPAAKSRSCSARRGLDAAAARRRRRLLPALAHPAEPRERVVDGRALRRRAPAQIGASAVQRLGRAGVAAREEREVALQQLGVDRVAVDGSELL